MLRQSRLPDLPITRQLEQQDYRYGRFLPLIKHAAHILWLWNERARQRKCLAELEDHQLVDIGRSRAEARRECAKAFWSA